MLTVLLLLLAAPVPPAKTAPKAAAAKTAGPPFEQLAAQAAAARDANNAVDAVALYRQAVKRKPTWAEGWYYIATLEYDRDHYAEARDAFRKLLPLDPKNGVAWGLLGLCEFQTKEYELALTHITLATGFGLGDSQQINHVVRYHKALLLTHFGQFEEAASELLAFARTGVEDPQIIAATGLASLRKPLLPADVPPADAELVMAAGRAVFDTMARHAAEAQKEMEALVAKYPTTPNVHYIYGSYLMFTDPEAGIRELQRELEISPKHVPAMDAIALQLMKNDDAKAALPYARKAVELAPNSFVTHNVYGRALADTGDLKPGIAELEYSRKLAPDSPQTRIALAAAYAKDGRKEDAARERAEFLKLKSTAEPAPAQK